MAIHVDVETNTPAKYGNIM